MNGLDVMAALLPAHAPLTAILPVGMIKVGTVPKDTPAPFVIFDLVVGTSYPVIDRAIPGRWSQRVQLTAFATSPRQLDAILRAAVDACAGRRPDMGDLTNIVITLGVEGPGMTSEDIPCIRAQDFVVGFNRAT